jgi:hypothetical protein
MEELNQYRQDYKSLSSESKKDLRNVHNYLIDAHDETIQLLRESTNSIRSPLSERLDKLHSNLVQTLLSKKSFDDQIKKSDTQYEENQSKLELIKNNIGRIDENSQTRHEEIENILINMMTSFTEKLNQIFGPMVSMQEKESQLLIQNERFSVVQDQVPKSSSLTIKEAKESSLKALENSSENILNAINEHGKSLNDSLQTQEVILKNTISLND